MTDYVAASSIRLEYEEIENSERNKLAFSDRAFHDWYRFVLSFPPHLVRQYLNEFEFSEHDLVLDPFCGTGTTVVESKKLKIPSIGIEANRFAQFAGSVKTDWSVDTLTLLEHAKGIKQRSIRKLKNQGISDKPHEQLHLPQNLLTLSGEKERLLLKDSISKLPLHKALVLIEEINRFNETSFSKYMRLAYAKALVYKISNLRFGPEVGVGRIKEDVAVIERWYEEVESIVQDLLSINHSEFPEAKVMLSDSRDAGNLLDGRKISGVITSPPYPNEKDYTRTTRLESVLLGFIKDKDDLRSMKKSLLRSNTRGIYKHDNDDDYVKDIKDVQLIADEIEQRRIDLKKTSGFEKAYAKVTKLYFGGMARHLSALKPHLKDGAMLAYVVGDQASFLRVMIRTGKILAHIADTLGYEVIRIDNFRTRFSTATKSNLNEEVVVLKWKGNNGG